MVECELNDMYQIVKANKVLIDTWWNVNVSRRLTQRRYEYVLIDT